MCASHRCWVLVWATARSRSWIPKGADFSWKSTFWPALFETLNIPTEQKEQKKKNKDIFTPFCNCARTQKLLVAKFNPSAAGKALTTDSCAGQRSLALHWTLSVLESNPVSFTSADSDPLQIQTYGRWCIYMPLIVLILGSLFVLHVNMHCYLSGHDDYSNFG